jgi:hypothetical protein
MNVEFERKINTYSLEELRNLRDLIDQDRYPEKYAAVLAQINKLEPQSLSRKIKSEKMPPSSPRKSSNTPSSRDGNMENHPTGLDDQATLFNPWLEIWTRPRQTIRRIVDTNPRQRIYFLASLNGVLVMPRLLQDVNSLAEGMGRVAPFTSVWISLSTTLVAGSLAGLVGLFIGTVLFVRTTSWYGGRASSENVRAALAWSLVPYIPVRVLQILPIFIVLLLPEASAASVPMRCLVLTITLIELSISIWAFVIVMKCLGEVEQFSAWRALVPLSQLLFS